MEDRPHEASQDVRHDYNERGGESITPALVGGGIAAVGGGIIWALVVITTDTEFGWIAWGVGVLVGLVLAKMTAARGQNLAITGAVLAVIGLLLGKVLIVSFGVKPALTDEIMADNVWLAQIAFEDLSNAGEVPENIQSQLDRLSETDTISDALWAEMQALGQDHLDLMTTAEQEQLATEYANQLFGSVSYFDLLKTQFSAWDLLWFGLAVATVWRFLNPPGTETE